MQLSSLAGERKLLGVQRQPGGLARLSAAHMEKRECRLGPSQAHYGPCGSSFWLQAEVLLTSGHVPALL